MSDGATEGTEDGMSDGAAGDGKSDGATEGIEDGMSDGAAEGKPEEATGTEGTLDG